MQRSNRLPVCPPPSPPHQTPPIQVSHDFAVNFNEENPECAGKRFDFLLSVKKPLKCLKERTLWCREWVWWWRICRSKRLHRPLASNDGGADGGSGDCGGENAALSCIFSHICFSVKGGAGIRRSCILNCSILRITVSISLTTLSETVS